MNKIVCSASDPGGGNALVSVIKELQKQKIETLCIVNSHSKEIFDQAGLGYIDAGIISKDDLRKIFIEFKPDLFVAGTSLGATVDKEILLWCKSYSVPSVYILDFWVNYWQRFSRQTKDFYYLPDYICVMDDIAKKDMCEEGFPIEKLVVTGNPFFDHFTDGIQSDNKKAGRILFISQPLRHLGAQASVKEYGYDEYGVLEHILKIILEAPQGFQLVIRLHPKEDPHKFDTLLLQYQVRVSLDDLEDVKKSLSKASLVIGMNSMVLFQAAVAGKTVISYQPGLEREDPLMSNRLGLSELITDVGTLGKRLKDYFEDSMGEDSSAPRSNIIIKQATQNVTDFLIHVLRT